MIANKIRHMFFATVELPVQSKDSADKKDILFLIDSGASYTMVPLHLLLHKELAEKIKDSNILDSHKRKVMVTADGTEVNCFVFSLHNVNILGHNLRTFRFLVADGIDASHAILGSDFIDSCTHYHTAGSSWDFRSFDVCRYNDIWYDIACSSKLECFTDVINSILSDKDLADIAVF